MTVLFESGFETADMTEFDEAVGDLSIINVSPLNGNYSLRCQTVGAGAEGAPERVYVAKTFGARKFCYAQMLVRVNENLQNDNDRVTLITFVENAGARGSFGYRRVNGVLRWYLIKASLVYADIGPVVGAEHTVEFYQDLLTDGLILYVDGVEAVRLPETSLGNLTGVRFGAVSYVSYPVSIDVDDCKIADAYIGTVPSHNLTVRSSPEIGVPVYIDEQFVGNTPLVIGLVAGTHTVRVEEEVTR